MLLTDFATLIFSGSLLTGLAVKNNIVFKFTSLGVGLGRVVRKVRQHPDDHEFESQRWQ
jgi:hypothetical protein